MRGSRRYDIVSRDGAILKEDVSKNAAKDFIYKSGLTGLRHVFRYRRTNQQIIEEIDAKLGEIFYAIGLLPPRYPVPAIPLKVVVGQEEYWDTVYIEDITDPESPYIVCMWDFNWDRCMDFGTKYGQYMNSREVEETVYVPMSSSV